MPNPYLEKLQSISFSQANFDTAERHNYFDGEAVDSQFGANSKEKMLDDTDGIGAVKQGPDGAFYHKDRKSGEIERLDDKQIDKALGG